MARTTNTIAAPIIPRIHQTTLLPGGRGGTGGGVKGEGDIKRPLAGWPVSKYACAARKVRAGLVEAHLHVRTLIEMYRVNEAHLAIIQGEDQRMRADAVAEEVHAAQQVAVGDAGAGEDDLLAGREVRSIVDAVGILDAHGRHALLV